MICEKIILKTDLMKDKMPDINTIFADIQSISLVPGMIFLSKAHPVSIRIIGYDKADIVLIGCLASQSLCNTNKDSLSITAN